ncbi:hypothetical protein C3L33_09981, partial [Rhododendron williamsianum]
MNTYLYVSISMSSNKAYEHYSLSSKFQLKDLVGVYLTEAKWCHEGYVPSMDEHMPIALLSRGHQAFTSLWNLHVHLIDVKCSMIYIWTSNVAN